MKPIRGIYLQQTIIIILCNVKFILYRHTNKIEFDLTSSFLLQNGYDARLDCQTECENYILSVLPEQSSQQIFPNDVHMHKKIGKNEMLFIFLFFLTVFCESSMVNYNSFIIIDSNQNIWESLARLIDEKVYYLFF